jgi:hypothetical protein
MKVKVQVELCASLTDADEDERYGAARHLTNNKESVVVYASDDEPNSIVAEFSIIKARQGDVADGIARELRFWVNSYSQSTISFPDDSSRAVKTLRSRYTRKQGQYLAFIYYYAKFKGYPPAEADMQRYFETTPPSCMVW